MDPTEYIQEALQKILKMDGINSKICKEAQEMLQTLAQKNKVCKPRKAIWSTTRWSPMAQEIE